LQIGKIIIKSVLILFLIETSLFAQEKAAYSIAYIGMDMDYREYSHGVLVDSEKSSISQMQGYELHYKYNFGRQKEDEYSTLDFAATYLWGETEYAGSYLSNNTGYGSVVGTTENEITDTVLNFSHTYHTAQAMEVSFGFGLGYRYWDRKLSILQEELYEWFSLRPNIALHYFISDVKLSACFEYQYGLNPKMSASNIRGDFNLGSANITETTLRASYDITDNFSIYGSYIYAYQTIQESNVVYDGSGNGYVEPDSKASNQYLKFGVTFKYLY